MQAQEVAIKPHLKITLKPDAKQLDEIIVVAYGTAKKSAFTGSASTIKADKLEERIVSNITNALSGQVAGIQTVNANGAPGSVCNSSYPWYRFYEFKQCSVVCSRRSTL